MRRLRALRPVENSRVRLSPAASVTTTAAGAVIRSDLGALLLEGEDVALFVRELVPLLAGEHTAAEVVTASGRSEASVMAFLDALHERGLLEALPESPEPGDEPPWRAQAQFLSRWTEDPEAALARLREARVAVVGLEPWGASLAGELAAAGVGEICLTDSQPVTADDLVAVRGLDESDLGEPRAVALAATLGRAFPDTELSARELRLDADQALALEGEWELLVTATTHDDLRTLEAVARFGQRAEIPSLNVTVDGLDAVVGPLVLPGRTACWRCYHLRTLANSDRPSEENELRAALLRDGAPRRSRMLLAPMGPLAGQLAALEATRELTGYTVSKLPGRLLVQNLVTLESSLHTVVRLPWCDVCGGAEPPADPPPQLQDTDDPDDVREKLAGWVDSRTGVIRHLAVSSPSPRDPQLPISATAVLGSFADGEHIHPDADVGSGKGLTSTSAMIGAVGEALERYSAARYSPAQLHRAAADELEGDVLGPSELCLYEDEQYARADFPYARPDPDQPLPWVRGRWLDDDSPVWLPALAVFFNFHAPPAERFGQTSSNGLAAGSDLADAATRALYELVERDSFMVSWLCQRPGPRLLVDDALPEGVQEAVHELERCGAAVELYLLDVNPGISTVLCLGVGDGTEWPGVTAALAAHADVHLAARKAILEQGHVGPYIRRLVREGEQPIPESPEQVRQLVDHALYYAPPERVGAFDFLRRSGLAPVRLDELAAGAPSLRESGRRLKQAGTRVAVADVTSPDMASGPFRVARALGRNLQPIHFGERLRRLANPRLRQFLPAAATFNPDPHPLA